MSLHTISLRRTDRRLPYIPNTSPRLSFKDSHYTVKLAQTHNELDEVLRLRYHVFNVELNEGLNSSRIFQKDEDSYDYQCDHLIVIDNKNGATIGTYRMQTEEMAKSGIGFYSGTEYKLEMIGDGILKNSVELGRACIHKEYRNTRVLFLLWRGIARYLFFNRKQYLFGCCSLKSQDPCEGNVLYEKLLYNNYTHPDIFIEPQPEYDLSVVKNNISQDIEIPPLLNMYLRYGAKIIGLPAIDREFKTIDYLVLLNTNSIPRQTFKLIIGK